MVILYKLVQTLTDKIGAERSTIVRDLDDLFVDDILVKQIHSRFKNNSIAQNLPKIVVIVAAILSESIRVEPAIASSLNIELNRPIIAINSDDNARPKNDLKLPQTGAEVRIVNNRSLSLQQAIEIALKNNRDVRVSRLSVDRNLAAVRQAQAAQSVQVGLTGSLTNQGSPVLFSSDITSTSGTSASAKLSATYSIFDAGRNNSNVNAAQEQVNFDRLDLQRVEQQLKSNVTTAYYDLQAADASVTIFQASVKEATRSLSDAQLQEKAGTGTKFDVLSAQVQLANANQNLTNALGTQQTARKKIAQLLSVDLNSEFTAADKVQALGNWDLSLEDSIVLAYKNRPEIKQSLVNREIAAQRQIAAAAGDAPQVSLFGNYSVGKSLSSSTNAQDDYSLGAQISWSFWDGGAANASANQQQVSREIAENQFTTQRSQIRLDVEQAYANLNTNKQNIQTATQALKQAEESLKLARLRFQSGVGTQTDVIQAQSNLTTARGNRITAIVNYNRFLSTLRIATVTGV